MKQQNNIILGIDPGLATTGYGIINKINTQTMEAIAFGTIETKAGLGMSERLSQIKNKLDAIIIRYQPQLIAVEELFFAKNAKTALAVGHARGVIILTGVENNIPVAEYTPLQIKQAITSYGRAEKKQMQQMVRTLLNLKEIPQPDDAADGLAVAITAACCYKLG